MKYESFIKVIIAQVYQIGRMHAISDTRMTVDEIFDMLKIKDWLDSQS